MDVDTMEAGPELDKMVATNVMKWRQAGDNDPLRWFVNDGGYIADGIPYIIRYGIIGSRWQPSTDIAAAWEAAEEVHLFDDRYIIETENGWGIYEFASHYEFAKELVVDAETAPLAICMALLIVAGVMPREK